MRKKIASPGIRKFALPALLLLALLLLSARAQYQFRRGGFGRSYGGGPEAIQEQDQMQKALNPNFKEDVFTFARLHFEADTSGYLGGGRQWEDDSPEADLNLTFRLFQVTSLKIRPGLNYVSITTQELEHYPFVYMAASGRLVLRDQEVTDLRRYLLNGGFLMADDFWGDDQWDHFYNQMKRVFPDREPVELSLDDRIFQSVFPFKKEPQMPSVGSFFQTGQSFEPYWPYANKDHGPHYYALYDDKHRMMAILCHNNHFGDGWEHESEDQKYFTTFSEPQAYPMFINIVYYAMTH
jgi:Domain of unknown function (DUF4159)